MIVAAIVAVLAALGFGAFALHSTGFRLPRWPEPTPRPYPCPACSVAFTDPRALAWHNEFHHPRESRE